MQQRRVRLGDILDDYCPRERRITNHAVVAMIDEQVKQTRCTTCQADHEYKGAKVPPPRRRKTGVLSAEEGEGVIRPRSAAPVDEEIDSAAVDDTLTAEPADEIETAADVDAPPDAPTSDAPLTDVHDDTTSEEGEEWPVHRRLIRATLPRPEGQVPERKAPDFTFRPGGGRFDAIRNGKRHRGHRPMRHGQGQGQGHSGPGQGHRPGAGPRHGSGQGPQGQRQGNRPGQGGGRPGQTRGPRQGSGGGRKRGR
jgi:hypothetical protein